MKSLFILSLLLIFGSCSPKIQYIGNRYSPTTQVELFFNKKDIKRNYTVMGKINSTDPTNGMNSYKKLQDKLVEKAKEYGADAILITGAPEIEPGYSTVNTTVSTKSERSEQAVKTVASATSVSNNSWRELYAELIKYK